MDAVVILAADSKRDVDYFDALAGYSGINPETSAIEDLLQNLGVLSSLTEEVQLALARARAVTQGRLRRLLSVLASDWAQFGDYFYAYKHGGLTVHRDDVAWVKDRVKEMTPDTPRRTPSLAAWRRGGKQMEGRGEFGLSPSEIATTVAGTGRLAIDLCDAFVESRLAVFEAAEFGPDGTIVALRPTQLPWTVGYERRIFLLRHGQSWSGPLGPPPAHPPAGAPLHPHPPLPWLLP